MQAEDHRGARYEWGLQKGRFVGRVSTCFDPSWFSRTLRFRLEESSSNWISRRGLDLESEFFLLTGSHWNPERVQERTSCPGARVMLLELLSAYRGLCSFQTRQKRYQRSDDSE